MKKITIENIIGQQTLIIQNLKDIYMYNDTNERIEEFKKQIRKLKVNEEKLYLFLYDDKTENFKKEIKIKIIYNENKDIFTLEEIENETK